ncbi:MAG TPA: YcxB family protein [Chitinophagaceae bacterium]|nr:YcxB family protein [Chitinophagaceae bacterium]
MQVHFTYDKKKVYQALRYHFLWQPEMRILLSLIIVFDVVTAILYFIGKIRPEPFLLGSCIWLVTIILFWYVMPGIIYRKNDTFRDKFVMDFNDTRVFLENSRGYAEWPWDKFTKFAESPHFFHLYFSPKSFFIIPKDNMSDEFKFDLRILMNDKIKPAK